MAVSLYRKYRPATFSDVVGQKHVEKTLTNAVRENNIAHAYLFCGPRGTGKTTTARLLAKALLCKDGPTPQPCGTCGACQEIADGVHPDVYELDAASHTGVENVREEIISRVQFAPTHGRYKVYIIDEVHMLSASAFNALLKTFEEPPEHVVFVLCTTEPHKVLDTIQSRCQRFDFHRFSIEEIVTYLRRICDAEGFKAETEALSLIAAKANGGMRDATTALEQVAVSTGGTINVEAVQNQLGQNSSAYLFEISEAIAQQRVADCFMQIQAMVNSGKDLTQFARDLSAHIRNTYIALLTDDQEGLIACSKAELGRYKKLAASFGGAQHLSNVLLICGDLINELRTSSDARLSIEIACTRMCRPESDTTFEALAARIERLENGTVVPHQQASSLAEQQVVQNNSQNLNIASVSFPEENTSIASEQNNRKVGREASADLSTQSSNANSASSAVAREAADASDSRSGQDLHDSPVQDSVLNSGTPEDSSDVFDSQSNQSSRDTSTQEKPQQKPSVAMSPARLLAAVLTEIKREHIPTSALLEGVNLEERGDAYALVFPKEHEFMMNLAQAPDSFKNISDAFEAVLGAHTEIRFEITGAASGVTRKKEASSNFGSDSSAASSQNNQMASSKSEQTLPQDDAAAELASMFSAFGDGISFEEV